MCGYQHWRQLQLSPAELGHELAAYSGAPRAHFAELLARAEQSGATRESVAREAVQLIQAHVDAPEEGEIVERKGAFEPQSKRAQ